MAYAETSDGRRGELFKGDVNILSCGHLTLVHLIGRPEVAKDLKNVYTPSVGMDFFSDDVGTITSVLPRETAVAKRHVSGIVFFI